MKESGTGDYFQYFSIKSYMLWISSRNASPIVWRTDDSEAKRSHYLAKIFIRAVIFAQCAKKF